MDIVGAPILVLWATPILKVLLSIDDAFRVTSLIKSLAITPPEFICDDIDLPLFPATEDIFVVFVIDFQFVEIDIFPVLFGDGDLLDILGGEIVLVEEFRVNVLLG